MFTIEPFDQWRERHVFEQVETTCFECDGTGECECCGRECLECDGTGLGGVEDLPEFTVQERYFEEVVGMLSQVCAFTNRHDFLEEVGHFIKHHGRPGDMHIPGIH